MALTLYSYIKTQKAIQQQETLLSFMSKYEKMIDDERVNKHEMLNNLLILRSFKNKNSKEFTETLDDLIKANDNIKDSIKNIYSLPPGLKGILYYKVYDMKALNIEVTMNISKKINSSFKSINSKEYNNLCKVITILLDNAKDAASTSKEKFVLIEFYIENDNLVFSIGNSYKDKVDINKLSTINYSTKGKGRGLGLFIANNIINNTKNMKLEQKIINDNIFSSILKIKNKN
jgi:two-component system sensor histidine kinase AgrC